MRGVPDLEKHRGYEPTCQVITGQKERGVPYELGWEIRGVVATYSGDLSANDVLDCHRCIASDPRFDDLRFAIVDTSLVQSLALTRADIEQIDAFLQGPACTNPNVKVVFVAKHPDVLAVLSSYDAMPGRAYKQVVCESAEAARALIASRRQEFRPRGSYRC